MATGEIKRLDRDRGCGFVRPAGASENVFFHSSGLQGLVFDQLNEGQAVELDGKAQRARAEPTLQFHNGETATELDHTARERGLLAQIGGSADRLRQLRQTGAAANRDQIKVLTSDLSTMWDQIRALRAPPVAVDVYRRHRSHYD